MNWGDIARQFRGIAWKRLTAHEVNPAVSNGHEFQSVGRLRDILGTEEAASLRTTYVLLHDDPDDVEVLRLTSKWYDARANNPDRKAEWRLYYPAAAGAIQARMSPGDLMVVAVSHDRDLLILLASAGSNRERQLQVLFNLGDEGDQSLQVRSLDTPVVIDFVTANLLEEIGLARATRPTGGGAGAVEALVDELAEKYPTQLPSGQTIAALVRHRIQDVDARADPDDALYHWIEAEAATYRAWEDRKIGNRLRGGFLLRSGEPDVDAFRKFSMALRQSRVSRAGGALQYHFREILDVWGIRYVMEPEVDGGEKPDFLFPSLEAYLDPNFAADGLRMLAAKFTAKDRWRQVLNEAERIPEKHLLTMDAAISVKQMDLMSRARLTLVVPGQVRGKYPVQHRHRLYTVADFIKAVSGDLPAHALEIAPT